LETELRVGVEIGSFSAGYRLTGLTIFCRTSGLFGIVGFVANLEMGLLTAEYRLNGPRILSRISEIVRFGGLSGIGPPEALG
jgi:hypothetical protein